MAINSFINMQVLKIAGNWDTFQTIEIEKGLCDKCNPEPAEIQEGEGLLAYHERYNKIVEEKGVAVLSIDTSDGEYGNVRICKECINEAFKQYAKSEYKI